MNHPSTSGTSYFGMPLALRQITETKHFFQALDNFTHFAFRPGDEVLMLADPLLDPRVIDAVQGNKSAWRHRAGLHGPSSRVTEIPGRDQACSNASWSPPGSAPSSTPSASGLYGQRWSQDHLLSQPRSAAHAAGRFPHRPGGRDHPRHRPPLPAGAGLRSALHRPAWQRLPHRLHA